MQRAMFAAQGPTKGTPMHRFRIPPRSWLVVIGVVFGIAISAASGLAFASVQRTFVASNGSDANVSNNCSIALPCRSFTAARH